MIYSSSTYTFEPKARASRLATASPEDRCYARAAAWALVPSRTYTFTALRSSQLTADTVRVFFEAERDGTTYIPRAGAFYNAETGQCS